MVEEQGATDVSFESDSPEAGVDSPELRSLHFFTNPTDEEVLVSITVNATDGSGNETIAVEFFEVPPRAPSTPPGDGTEVGFNFPLGEDVPYIGSFGNFVGDCFGFNPFTDDTYTIRVDLPEDPADDERPLRILQGSSQQLVIGRINIQTFDWSAESEDGSGQEVYRNGRLDPGLLRWTAEYDHAALSGSGRCAGTAEFDPPPGTSIPVPGF